MSDEISPAVKAAFAKEGFDPHQVPVRRAATILIVDDRPDLQVLMMRRNVRSNFVGGMMVFPGGGLDERDDDPGVFARVRGIDDAAASQAIGVARGGLAFWIAAIRETFEECGVLLAADHTGRAPTLALDERESHDDFVALVERHDLTIDASGIERFAQWTTPVGPPRRYDTWFFLCAMPKGQHATGDDDEAEHLAWVRPSDGMARWRSGEYVMLPPTVASLQQLERYSSAAEVREAFAGDGVWAPAKVLGDERGSFRVALPGDADYDEVVGRETGWVRVR